MSHAWLWGAEPSNPIDARTDPTILITGAIVTIATAALILESVLHARRRGSIPRAGIPYILIGLLLAGYVWLGVAGMLP